LRVGGPIKGRLICADHCVGLLNRGAPIIHQLRRKLMDTEIWVLLIVVALLVGAAAAWFFLQQQRSRRLRDQFGPEYDRTLQDVGDRRKTERELERRQERVSKFEIRPLSPDDQERFAERWDIVQTRFVDHPNAAVAEADELLIEVMRTRGYPVGDFEQNVADLSVDHPRFVDNYRAAHEITARRERGDAGTEDLRQAMVHYRELFKDLIGSTSTQTLEVKR
jgi:hypothetical protein